VIAPSVADADGLIRPVGGDVLTVAAARRALTATLRAAGIETPELDARVLVGHALALDHAALAAADARTLNGDEREAIATLGRRRLAREPVARIVGGKEFWSLPLRVDASTLVPRPETETVVAATLAEIERRGARHKRLRLVDLGTGSGALLLALLSELPNAYGIGTDISASALRIARENARRLGLHRAAFVAADMTAPLRGPLDLIVSNPPYVASADIATLAREVRAFDPPQALDGGRDGLDYYRVIAASAPASLVEGGFVAVELGAGQAEAVSALFAAAGLAVRPPHADLSGVPRALVATIGVP
jgi:release factor glutamine methyltransferase